MNRRQEGGITLIVLVMLIVFIIIMSASIQYISRQSNQTSRRSQEEQAFGLADAGVQYTLWLLSQTQQPYTPTTLPASLGDHHVIREPNNGPDIGYFIVEVVSATNDPKDPVRIRSIGYDAVLPDLCQAVNADLHRFEDDVFRVTKWDHEVGYPC